MGYELDRFLHKALGRQMSESARRSPLPPDWKDLIIPASNIVGKTDQFPRADRFVGGTSANNHVSPSLGTVVENNELFSPAPENRGLPAAFHPLGQGYHSHSSSGGRSECPGPETQ